MLETDYLAGHLHINDVRRFAEPGDGALPPPAPVDMQLGEARLAPNAPRAR